MFGTVDFIQGYKDGYQHNHDIMPEMFKGHTWENDEHRRRHIDYNTGWMWGWKQRSDETTTDAMRAEQKAQYEKALALELESYDGVMPSDIVKEITRDYADSDVMDALDSTNWNLAPMFPKGS